MTRPAPSYYTKGRKPPEDLNRTELAYRAELGMKKQAGLILDFKSHPFRIRLADNTYYEVDFYYVALDEVLTLVEVKAGDRNGRAISTDTSNVKIKVAAEQNPHFRFVRAIRVNHGFIEEEV